MILFNCPRCHIVYLILICHIVDVIDSSLLFFDIFCLKWISSASFWLNLACSAAPWSGSLELTNFFCHNRLEKNEDFSQGWFLGRTTVQKDTLQCVYFNWWTVILSFLLKIWFQPMLRVVMPTFRVLTCIQTPLPVALPCASSGTFSIEQLTLPLMCYTATCSV